MSKATTRTAVVIIIMIVLVVTYFTYLSNKNRNELSESTSRTRVEKLLNRDLVNDYPPTPREVVKLYSDIISCIYGDDCTDEQIEQLIEKTRLLFDDELNEYNEWDIYFTRFNSEIADFKEKEKKISSYSIPSSTEVDYDTIDGYTLARIRCNYYILEGKVSKTANHVYLLREDSDGRWKIYGWDSTQNVDM